MARNKGLGRGLDAIFNDNSISDETASGVTKIRISQIEPKKDQPRKLFDNEALAQLADSIAANGVLQPILVRESNNGMYSIIAGERRWRASKLAGQTEIPAIIMDADEFTAAKIAMIENLQRENLNPCEEARGYAELMSAYSLTQEEIAEQIGKSRSAIANSMRLLDLPEEIMDMLATGTLSAGHGRTLLGLKDKSKMIPLAERTAARNLSVRELEATVKKMNREAPEEKKDNLNKVDYIADLESKVTSIIGRRCKITSTPRSKFIQIEFVNNDDLEDILKRVCGRTPVDD